MAALAQTNTHPCAISTYLETTMTTFSLLLLHYGATEVLPSRAESFLFLSVCVCVCVCTRMHAQSRPILCDFMNCSPPSSSVYGIFQARILEWVATSYSRGSSRPRDQTHVSCVSCIVFSAGGFFTISTTWEASLKST